MIEKVKLEYIKSVKVSRTFTPILIHPFAIEYLPPS